MLDLTKSISHELSFILSILSYPEFILYSTKYLSINKKDANKLKTIRILLKKFLENKNFFLKIEIGFHENDIFHFKYKNILLLRLFFLINSISFNLLSLNIESKFLVLFFTILEFLFNHKSILSKLPLMSDVLFSHKKSVSKSIFL
jgi:hypothetical protein